MEQQERFYPKGKATDVFDRGAAKRFQTDLYNLALDKDVAKKRNLLYMVLLALCVVAMVFVVTTANFIDGSALAFQIAKAIADGTPIAAIQPIGNAAVNSENGVTDAGTVVRKE